MGWLKKSAHVVDLFDYSCRLPRIAGVLPFSMRGRRFKVSKLLALYDASLVLAQLAFDALLVYLLSFEKMSFVSYLVKTAQQLSGSVTTTFSLLWIFRSKSSLQLALAEMVKFEEIVQPNALTLSARPLVLIYAILFTISGIDLLFTNTGVPIIARLILVTRFHSTAWMMFAITLNFTFFISVLEESYQALSGYILTNLKVPHNLRNIQKAAEHLMSACEELNAAFGPQMLLITSASFVLITGNIYLALMSGWSEEFLQCVWWIVIHTKLMLHLISRCTSAVRRAEKFERTLYQTVLEDRTGNLSQEIRTCLHFTNNRKVEFNAFGFFTIDFTLAGSMIAAATTYLVILIQIGDTEKDMVGDAGKDMANSTKPDVN